MKKQIKIAVFFLFWLASTGTVYGQGLFALKKRVKGMPKSFERPSATASNFSGNSSGHPWIVFSDRVGNFTTAKVGSVTPLKELEWMEPLFVLKERAGYLKVAKYEPDIIKGKPLRSSKKLVACGWIAKSNVLLSQRAFVNAENGFSEKAITLVNGTLPALTPLHYFDLNDSVYVFNSPGLTQPIGKVRLHELAYRFKIAADKKSVLIGNKQQLLPGSAKKVVYGWISTQALQSWGDRVYLIGHRSPIPTADPLLRPQDVPLKGFPVINVKEDSLTVRAARDVYRKENNSVIAIDGSSLHYPAYLGLREHLPKLNVIWVLDAGSAMKRYFAGLTNIIQSLEVDFKQYSERHLLHYGAVVYRDDQNCAFTGLSSMDTLTPDYRSLMRFLKVEAEKTASCNNGVKSVPLYDGVRRALDLCKDQKDESNLIVVVGSVGDSANHIRQLPAQIGAHNARILTVQMYSDYNEWYNNFVLNAKELVSESAVFVAGEKKKYLIDGEGLNDKQMYNTSQLDSISYYLDYPVNSLVQGGVVFPTKGDVISKKQIRVAIRRLLKETDEDISKQLRSLDSAFRLSGIAHEKVSTHFFKQFGGEEDVLVGDQMPHNGFKFSETFQLPKPAGGDLAEDAQYLLILNQLEYDETLDILQKLSRPEIEANKPSSRRILYRNYRQMLLALQPGRSKRMMKMLPLSEYLRQITGLPLLGDAWKHYRVRDIRKSMPIAAFKSYQQYLKVLFDSFQGQGTRQRFLSNGQAYYFITEDNLISKSAKQ